MKRIKNIKLGAIQISNWDSEENRMFSYSWYYDKNADFHDDSCDKEIKQCNPDEVVLPPDKEYTLVIDYPVSTNYEKKFKTGHKGMTRLKLVDFICKHYRRMYAEEDKSAEGEGKYGIWGHSIGDLILVDADVYKNKITLGVDS